MRTRSLVVKYIKKTPSVLRDVEGISVGCVCFHHYLQSVFMLYINLADVSRQVNSTVSWIGPMPLASKCDLQVVPHRQFCFMKLDPDHSGCRLNLIFFLSY